MLTISPFPIEYAPVYNAILAALPDTDFILKAPIILPWSDQKPNQFVLTANEGDTVEVFVNGKFRTKVIASSAKNVFDLTLDQGKNFVLVRTTAESHEISIAATRYATIHAGWAEQFFREVYLKIQQINLQLNSRFSLYQVEHQLLWNDLLPKTRVMRILAGKMAVKSLINMAPTQEGVFDIAKAVTGNTPIVLPTLLDRVAYEPECKLLYSGAHNYSGYEFNIWLLNLCASSWQAFVKLANNLPDDVMSLVSVTDRKVTVKNNGITETHNFDFETSECQVLSILTRFFDCFSRMKVFARLIFEESFNICTYRSQFDVSVENPLGIPRFDQGLPLDQDPAVPFDSMEVSDPYGDGLVGLPIGCRLDSGTPLDTTFPVVLASDDFSCSISEPCLTGGMTSLTDTTIPYPMSANMSFSSGPGLGYLYAYGTDGADAFLARLHPITLTELDRVTYSTTDAAEALYVPATNTLWLCQPNTNQIVVVNADTLATETTVSVAGPISLKLVESTVYVGQDTDALSFVNIDTYVVTTNTIIYVGLATVSDVLYDVENDRLYVARGASTAFTSSFQLYVDTQLACSTTMLRQQGDYMWGTNGLLLSSVFAVDRASLAITTYSVGTRVKDFDYNDELAKMVVATRFTSFGPTIQQVELRNPATFGTVDSAVALGFNPFALATRGAMAWVAGTATEIARVNLMATTLDVSTTISSVTDITDVVYAV